VAVQATEDTTTEFLWGSDPMGSVPMETNLLRHSHSCNSVKQRRSHCNIYVRTYTC